MEKGPTERQLQHFACPPTPRQPTCARMGSNGTQRMLSGSLAVSKPHAGQQSAHMGLGPITRYSQSWESPGDAGADVNPSLNTLAGVQPRDTHTSWLLHPPGPRLTYPG